MSDSALAPTKGARRAVFSLGSNLGDRLAHLRGAVAALGSEPGVRLVGVSGVYETAPVGVSGHPDYLNAIVVVESALSAEHLLSSALAIETTLGRRRPTSGVAPRTVDIDLIAAGDEVVSTALLTLPHPRAHERAFVLLPWVELDPEAQLRPFGSAKSLLAGLDATGVVPRPDLRIEVP
ncbi:MAG: 2-amino-4-hydroxy-6-hydroxymethyldihydropteridine diphosphokinase [Propionibacteriaceae bacterium]|nr:2-amino-4-hydroxy-6-hydroxymethyldihydropteridine diphosphokinase [Micropruina sp.]